MKIVTVFVRSTITNVNKTCCLTQLLVLLVTVFNPVALRKPKLHTILACLSAVGLN